MQPHPLTSFAANLAEEYGAPAVLDVEHSIQVYRPTLTGSRSVASYYIRPPGDMSAEELIKLFERSPGFQDAKLTLIPILGLDTYHQPLIPVDDFAKKFFGDNNVRIVRVVGKSNQAIEGMAAFIEGLKPPFDAHRFPHHEDFSVSQFRTAADARHTEVKLLFKPADANLLMKVERMVRMHLDEINLSREISTARHSTREQPPELILSSVSETPAGHAFLASLAKSLPEATAQDVAASTQASLRAAGSPVAESATLRATLPRATVETLPPAEIKRRATAGLAEILRSTRFANGLEIRIVHAGSAIEATFPRTPASLWLSTSFDEQKHIKAVAGACVSVRTDPLLREGWVAHYSFDRGTGKLQVRAVDPGVQPVSGAKVVPHSG